MQHAAVSSVQQSGKSTQRGRLTVDDICDDLGISRRTFYEWRAKGNAPKCIKLPNGELTRSACRIWTLAQRTRESGLMNETTYNEGYAKLSLKK